MADVKELNINNTTYSIKDTVARNGLNSKQDILISGENIKTINGNSILGSGNISIQGGGTTENDTLPLFYGAYFDYTPNNVSWVLAGGQVVSGTIYTFAYNELVNELTTPKYGLQVIEEDDMVVGIDYSTYWKVNQDQRYFIAPTKLSYGALTGGVKGDGKVLGVTDGTNTCGTLTYQTNSSTQIRGFITSLNAGTPVGTTSQVADGLIPNLAGIGVSIDSTNSGIVAEQSTTAKLYFKVANVVQSLELLDAGEVLEAVNDVIPNNSSLIARYAAPSNTYRNLTLGASGTTYIAPADGYFAVMKTVGSDFYYMDMIVLDNNDAEIYRVWDDAYRTSPVALLLFVKKGTKIKINYNATGVTHYFRFIYAVGSEWEAQ